MDAATLLGRSDVAYLSLQPIQVRHPHVND